MSNNGGNMNSVFFRTLTNLDLLANEFEAAAVLERDLDKKIAFHKTKLQVRELRQKILTLDIEYENAIMKITEDASAVH